MDTSNLTSLLLEQKGEVRLLLDKESKQVLAVIQGPQGFISVVSDCPIGAIEALEVAIRNWKPYVPPVEDTPPSRFSILTKRQIEIATLLARGWGTRKIGKHLFISPRTVDTHRSQLLQRLGITTNAELAALAVREGLIE